MVKDFKSAMEHMRKPMFINTPKYQEQQSRANRDGADPDILEFERRLVKRLRANNIPVFAHTMVRTQDEQQALVNKGVSKDSPLDGLWPHMAYAVDIVHGVYAWDIPKPCWDVLGHLGKEISVQAGIPVTWGGDWKFYDPAHWELKDWKQRARSSSCSQR